MPQWDMPPAELEAYRSDFREPDDFDEFWARTMAEARSHPLDLATQPVDAALPLLDIDDVTFSGFGGHRIRAWFLRPRGATGLPVVVGFQGYGGGRGLSHEWTMLPCAGYAHLVVDTRGQGSGHRVGATADPIGSGPHVAGFLTSGIRSREQVYHRRVLTDAARAVEAAAALPGIDPSRIVTSGASQGGAMSLAASVLSADLPNPPVAAFIDVPFLQDIGRAIRIVSTGPTREIAAYLRAHIDAEAEVARTLGYLDGLAFAARARIPASYSVGLMDDVCPPSTVYASFNRYAGPKHIDVYPFAGHEGGGAHQHARQLRYLREMLPD
ncbi:acetylxylan esterase [Agromyces silvae]|uniref:acetylxylan esterase n=1 Tax=Agromyces silvae TaxID=3388266 RepID=UPI00280A8103|nr:acetylxylan esterase [Agromyces protaetiae]